MCPYLERGIWRYNQGKMWSLGLASLQSCETIHFQYCQPMVIGTNSVPTETPNLGYGKEGNFTQWKQLNCDAGWLWEQHCCGRLHGVTAQLWNSPCVTPHGWEEAWGGLGKGGPGARSHSDNPFLPSLPCLLFSAPARWLWCFLFSASAPARKIQCTLGASVEGGWHINRSPCPWSPIGPSCK